MGRPIGSKNAAPYLRVARKDKMSGGVGGKSYQPTIGKTEIAIIVEPSMPNDTWLLLSEKDRKRMARLFAQYAERIRFSAHLNERNEVVMRATFDPPNDAETLNDVEPCNRQPGPTLPTKHIRST